MRSVMFRWAGTSSCLLLDYFYLLTYSFPITGTVRTRFTGRIGITGLCGTCVRCLWSSHFWRKEKSSLQET